MSSTPDNIMIATDQGATSPANIIMPSQGLEGAEQSPTARAEITQEDNWKPTKRFLLAFTSLLSIVAAVAIESTSLPTALAVMSSELGGTALQAFWSGTSYLLASTVLQPSIAAMSHILGRKNVKTLFPPVTEV
jgi:hypothetical protein